ncbi:MAG TPA: SpoIID/LytB domain-containing protein [bacterium]
MRRALAVAACLAPAALAGAADAPSGVKSIRVALAQQAPAVAVQVQGPFVIRAVGTGVALRDGSRLEETAVRPDARGLRVGDDVVPSEAVRVEPARPGTLWLDGRHLRGALEITRQSDTSLRVVNDVDLEDYLRGVLSKEAPDHWPQEVLKAIAISARTYAVYRRLTRAEQPYDVTGDVMSQDYGGKTSEKRATSLAVKASRGWILTWQGAVFPAFYHSTCGGLTEHARVMGSFDLPPLSGGVLCEFCAGSPFFRWQRRLSLADLAWALKKSPHGSVGAVRDLRVTARTPSGRVSTIEIAGATGTRRLSGYDFRAMFGFEELRSLKLAIRRAGDTFVVDGQGWGHGVGMCQWGAAELARRGWFAEDILALYYPQAELVQLHEIGESTLTAIGGS